MTVTTPLLAVGSTEHIAIEPRVPDPKRHCRNASKLHDRQCGATTLGLPRGRQTVWAWPRWLMDRRDRHGLHVRLL